MKKIYALLLTVLCSSFSYAQDPELFEHTWYLQYGEYEEEVFYPLAHLTGELTFDNQYFEASHNYCKEGIQSLIEYNNDGQTFNLDEVYVVLIGSCYEQEDLEFLFYHYHIYGDAYDTGTPKNPFTYTLETDGENYTLTIENVDGDYAVYGDQKLSTHEFENNKISIHPNPVSETLHIIGNKDVIRANIYSITGQQIVVLNDAAKEIDVRLLQNGLYFLELEASDGSNQVIRFVKE